MRLFFAHDKIEQIEKGRQFMRLALSVIFSILITSLIVCMIFAKRSKKSVGNVVAFLIFSMAIPVLGNLIIIVSTNRLVSTVGYYIYYLGMSAAVYSCWIFTHNYCELGKPKRIFQILLGIFFGIDVLLYALNPFFNWSFSTEMIFVEDKTYFRAGTYI